MIVASSVVSSIASLAAIAMISSMSFTANVMPVGTGAPSHVERDVRIVSQRPSAVEATRGHASAVETRNAGAPSVASNLRGDRDGDLRNIPVGGMIRHREGVPSMTDSREGEASAFQ
jgi:hypothetical protein